MFYICTYTCTRVPFGTMVLVPLVPFGIVRIIPRSRFRSRKEHLRKIRENTSIFCGYFHYPHPRCGVWGFFRQDNPKHKPVHGHLPANSKNGGFPNESTRALTLLLPTHELLNLCLVLTFSIEVFRSRFWAVFSNPFEVFFSIEVSFEVFLKTTNENLEKNLESRFYPHRTRVQI